VESTVRLSHLAEEPRSIKKMTNITSGKHLASVIEKTSQAYEENHLDRNFFWGYHIITL
jgi:hypothetical protein